MPQPVLHVDNHDRYDKSATAYDKEEVVCRSLIGLMSMRHTLAERQWRAYQPESN